MKINNRIYSLLAATALFAMSSCEKDYLDVNKNPNSLTSATPQLVLPAALNNASGGNYNGTNGNSAFRHLNEVGSIWSGQWSPSGSISGFNEEKQYNIAPNFRTAIWSTSYDNLQDFNYVLKSSTAQGLQGFAGIARVMKAFDYQLLVDAYGNVPYTDALQGTKVIHPKYDDAKAIYENLIVQLDSALIDLKAPISSVNISPGSSDIYFKGDLTKWAKFANTLKLRILMRQSLIPGRDTYIKAEIAKILAEGSGFLGAGQNVVANPGYLSSAGKQNPFYEYYGYTPTGTLSTANNYFGLSDFTIGKLQTYNDPRLGRIASPVGKNAGTAGDASSVYTGMPLGVSGDQYLYSKISGFGPGLIKAFSQDQVVMTASASFFLQAEAVERGFMAGNAQVFYENGIKESFKLLGVTNAETAAQNYYTSGVNNVDWSASSNKIEAIITQKWLALVGFGGFEAWSEFRRTGYPTGVPRSAAAGTNARVVRLVYPTSEISTNNESVKAQGTIDPRTTRLFWDVD